MTDSEKNLFKLMGELSTYIEGSPEYKYCSEQIKERRTLLEALGAPYFEEIKRKTKGIQKELKEHGYENIDLQIKSLFIDGILFLGGCSPDRPLWGNKVWEYLKGLFYTVGIDSDNTKLLREILSELEENRWEKLPPSPLEFLVNLHSSKKVVVQRTKLGYRVLSR